GGDHTITYPILQAVAGKHGPVGLVHVDAHTDTSDRALGEKIYHGTPFRRCVEEGLLDCSRVVQIGIRGSSYDPDPYKYCQDQVSSAAGMRRVMLSFPAALEIIRGCKGLNIVGCDLVEVAPMYDVSGNTALLAANLLFEMLCVLPGVKTT
ncbi:SPEB protein, partial [Glareola pratincola]|nr:SPEB protein [Glareola pratincola]